MSETRQQREVRIRRWSSSREKCRQCGFLRINVRHEPDPENAPEGPDYYTAMGDVLHEFVPSGEYDQW